MNTKVILNILAALVVIALIFFGYRLIFKSAPDEVADGDVGLVAAGFAENPLRESADEFLQILLSLKKLDLVSGAAFFANPGFQSLRDFATELQMKEPGKENPFAPILGRARVGDVFDSNRASSTQAAPARSSITRPAGSSSSNSPGTTGGAGTSARSQLNSAPSN